VTGNSGGKPSLNWNIAQFVTVTGGNWVLHSLALCHRPGVLILDRDQRIALANDAPMALQHRA